MAGIEFRNVNFGYEKDKVIIENASFELGPEESICVVGPNGGGKSTLIRLLLGLIRPWAGQIRIF
ncbi:MAG: ATP-binding cassette domain-containing protein, partial [Verrucomicrobiota bacterium]|nr:ATP-binding cassette domain-containing protein [Verrucomicrobiota bacterium]